MGKPLRVLIVEDSEDDALLLLRELQRDGYDVEFERVEIAAAMLSALAQKTWDLILSDYSLPAFNALQALDVLKASDLDLPFIIISGTIGEETAVAALKAGANDFLTKGNFARLVPAIERELREVESRRERRQAEEQRKYQARLLRHINDAVIATDDQLRITAWNRAAERMYGWSGEEVMGRSISEILSDELTDEQRAEARELLQHSSASHSERIYRRKNGRTVYVEANTIALTDVQGKLTGYLSVDRDITERKQAEQAIESLAKFPYEDISPVLRFARDGRLLYANPASADLLKMWGCAIGEQPPDEIQMIVYQSLVMPMSQEIEVTHGDKIDALMFVPIVDKDYVNVYGRDITERKQAEEGLRQSERKFKRLFEIAPVGISLLDQKRKVLNMNPVLEEILHLTHSEVTNGKFRERKYILPNGTPLTFEQLPSARALWENRPILGEEFGIVIEDGKIVWVQVSATPLDLPDARVVVVTQDITERRQAEENLRQLNVELEHRVAERTIELTHANRAKDEFLASMSHELRTPLNTILGLSETLLEQRRGPLNEKQTQSIQLINSSGQHLLGLINDILEVSKVEAGKLEIHPDVISVTEVCESSLNFVREIAAKKSVQLEFSIQQDIVRLQADPRRFKQILVNLLSNAVKFTPEKGSVRLEVTTNLERDQIKFSVIDSGIGIAPEQLPKLFKPFTQLDSSLARQYEGTGLGLVLVSKFTELHGGSVHMESEVGKGSRFTVILPWDESISTSPNTSGRELPSLEEALPESMLPAKDLGLVLLAEDSETNIIVFRDYLQDHGFPIAVAHNGFEALDQAEKLSPGMILMDIQMPEMDGLEAIRRLRAQPRFAFTPIIALTALAMPGDRERCLEAGANDYLSKPVSLKKLLKIIQDLMEQK